MKQKLKRVNNMYYQEERANRLQEIEANRAERLNKRRLHRAQQTENFYKSLHMLQANSLLRETGSSGPFEDYSIYMYRQSAPEFTDRVKDLERKLLYPVRRQLQVRCEARLTQEVSPNVESPVFPLFCITYSTSNFSYSQPNVNVFLNLRIVFFFITSHQTSPRAQLRSVI